MTVEGAVVVQDAAAKVLDDFVESGVAGLHHRAAHLVGPGGQEWWITPQSSLFGDAGLLSTLPEWCPDAQIVADDDAFNAVRVGVGRMGVIYSVILEVVEDTPTEFTVESYFADGKPAPDAGFSWIAMVPGTLVRT